jgi:hypothetical protein
MGLCICHNKKIPDSVLEKCKINKNAFDHFYLRYFVKDLINLEKTDNIELKNNESIYRINIHFTSGYYINTVVKKYVNINNEIISSNVENLNSDYFILSNRKITGFTFETCITYIKPSIDLVVKLKDKTLTDVYNYLNIGYI